MKNLDWKISESKKVIEFSLKKWSPNIGLAFTARKDSTVLLDMVRKTGISLPTLMFIDHGLHYKKSISHLKYLQKLWGLNIYTYKDINTIRKIKAEKSSKIRGKLIDAYKIKAIKYSIKVNGWNALMSAIRWDEHPERADSKYFLLVDGIYRVHPLLHFTEEDIWNYTKINKLPINPLYDEGYRSFEEQGTKKVFTVDKSERSGRRKDKEEIMGRLRKLGYF